MRPFNKKPVSKAAWYAAIAFLIFYAFLIFQFGGFEMKRTEPPSIKKQAIKEAIENNNPQTCQNTVHIDSCLSEVAKETRDISICGQVSGNRQYQDPRWECIAPLLKSPSDAAYCVKSECFINAAVRLDSAEVCLQVPDINKRNNCIKGYISKTAANNPEYCQQIPLASLTGITASYEGEFQDYCYSLVASRLQNPTICSNIQQSSVQQECLQKALGQ